MFAYATEQVSVEVTLLILYLEKTGSNILRITAEH